MPWLHVESWIWLSAGMAAALGAAVIAWWRGIQGPAAARGLVVLGMALVAVALGGLVWRGAGAGQVVVMVDLSPSTRGAIYRDGRELRRRVEALLGERAYSVLFFGQHNQAVKAIAEQRLSDMPAERTVYAPPAGATALLLFSDGRFDPPAVAPPTYVVVDPALEAPGDGAVQRVEVSAEGAVRTAVANAGASRTLQVREGARQQRWMVERGDYWLEAWTDAGGKAPAGDPVVAELLGAGTSVGDRWPENDRIDTAVPPAAQAQRWWVGAHAPPGWRQLSPAALPAEPGAYLSAGVIVLNDVPAGALSGQQMDRLEQYVRDLGGSVLLLGGEQAFGAGGYEGTAMERLSPLAGQPPEPAMRWVLLADGSGSMAAQATGTHQTRWQVAGAALAGVAGALPPEDAVSAGSFAQALHWWVRARRSAEVAPLPLPPPGATPGGPTNLQAALQQVVDQTTGQGATQLLVMTDAEASLKDVARLAQQMKARGIHLSVLAIGEGEALAGLRRIAGETGGQVRTELNPAQWARGAKLLAQAALPDRVRRQDITVRFERAAAALPAQQVAVWNQTWLKEGAQAWAGGESEGKSVVLGGHWDWGSGQVAALAFSPSPVIAEAVAGLVQARARDPRLKVRWEQGPMLRITAEAVEANTYLNGLGLTLELQQGNASTPTPPRTVPMPQVGPGTYAVALPAPREAMIATVRYGQTVVDRRMVAGRYAPEFEQVGNDHEAMQSLAARTGGRVIGVREVSPIKLVSPRRNVRLDAWSAAAGALLIAAGAGWMREVGK